MRAGGTSGNRRSGAQPHQEQVESGGEKSEDFIPGGMISVHTRIIQHSCKNKKMENRGTIAATCWSRLPLHLVRFAGLTAGVVIRTGLAFHGQFEFVFKQLDGTSLLMEAYG